MAEESSGPSVPQLDEIRRYVERWSSEPLIVHKLRENVFWVAGAGGNSGVVIGDDGVIVIDAKVSAAAGRRLLDAIAKLTPKPVTDVILTHGDGDHVMGLASFPANIKIIAHSNARTDMEKMNAMGLIGSLPASALPNQLFDRHQSVVLQSIRFELLHYGPSHTQGDAVIYLPHAGVVFAGDILNWGGSPTPTVKDGSAAGWLRTVEKMLELDADVFVTGHGEPESKSELAQELDFFSRQYKQIGVMIAQGRSLDEVEAAMAVEGPAPQSQGMRLPSFASSAFFELTEGTHSLST